MLTLIDITSYYAVIISTTTYSSVTYTVHEYTVIYLRHDMHNLPYQHNWSIILPILVRVDVKISAIIRYDPLMKSKLWETCQKRKFKAMEKYKTVQILLFFLWFTVDRTDSKWPKYNIKAFYKTRGLYSYNQWNYLQRGCMDKWRSGDFSLQTCCIPLEAFASKMIEI